MADLDTLIVTFQTQLSDVMETVVKTAMFEVTRLVEDGFLEEVKRRHHEVESLRIQLQWAERKLSDQEGKEGGGKTGKCVDCAKEDVEMSSDTAEQRPREQQDDILRDCVVKSEGDSMERWTRSQQEVIPEAADNPTDANSPTLLTTEEEDEEEEEEEEEDDDDDVLPMVDVKEEQVNNPSCSALRIGWIGTLEGEAAPESHSVTEITEALPKQPQVSSEELLGTIIKQDPQISAAYVFTIEQEETHMDTDLSSDVDGGWTGLTVEAAGLLQNHRLEQELPNSVTADVNGQISVSTSPPVRLQNSDALGVTIKQEVIVDTDGCVESKHQEKKMTKSRMASFSCSVKQPKVSLETLKQNHISHKTAVQEVMKLHTKVGTGLRLHAVQNLHRPMKKPTNAVSTSTSPAAPVAHSQAMNLNPLNRIPSTSKAAPSPSLSAHLGDKHAAAHNRTAYVLGHIKAQLQSANSHHSNPLSHPDSHPNTGSRHLLRCGQCGKCFPHPSNLKAHLQTHTGERPFCCSLCGRSFTKLSNLKAHRRVHTGERPYCCLACGKRFTQKCNLKRHQRIHLDV